MAVSRAAALRPDAKTVLERLRSFPFDSAAQFVKRFLMEKEPVYASLIKITGRVGLDAIVFHLLGIEIHN